MPRGAPFTALCRQLAEIAPARMADLHVHTTSSDGSFTPSQVVAFAHRAKLKAVAITDHDTTAGLVEARRALAELAAPGPELVAGVEITTWFADREVHLLGYFLRDDHPGLNAALAQACERRRVRFEDFVTALAAANVVLPEASVESMKAASTSLGRRHLVELLLRCGLAKSRHGAWQRFVGPLTSQVATPRPMPIAEALDLVRSAGGVSSLAHPPADFGETEFCELCESGLEALEASYPWGRSSTEARLRELAGRVGLLISGGSDCHGPDPTRRFIGTSGISMEELGELRARAWDPNQTSRADA